MLSMTKVAAGATFTVVRIKNRPLAKRLEGEGILPGADIRITAVRPDFITVEYRGHAFSLTQDEAVQIILDEPLQRGPQDPVFLGGCCAYGNSARVWDEFVNEEKQDRE